MYSTSKAGKRDGEKGRVQSEEHGPVETAQPAARQMYESLTRTRSGPACVPLARGKGPVLARVGGSAGKPVPAVSATARIQWPATKKAVRKCSVHFFTASFLLSNLISLRGSSLPDLRFRPSGCLSGSCTAWSAQGPFFPSRWGCRFPCRGPQPCPPGR